MTKQNNPQGTDEIVIDDGVIKYDHSDFSLTPALGIEEYEALEYWRSKLFQLKLIGEYPKEKVGYGNLSWRKNYRHLRPIERPQFVISGTQTGALAHLSGEHYARVIDYHLEENKISTSGPIQASSEALTHASLYEISKRIQAVFHIHDTVIWEGMLRDQMPATPKDIPYGTVEMANYVKTLFPSTHEGLFVMAGHQDGVIAFADSLDRAGELIVEVYKKYHQDKS